MTDTCALCDRHLGDDNLCHHSRFLCFTCCYYECREDVR